MTQAETNISTTATASRRSFLSRAAALTVGSAAVAVTRKADALPTDDSALLKREDQIFEQYEAATAYDDEIIRLSNIWQDESRRLFEESTLPPAEQWALVKQMPEAMEHTRLSGLQDPIYAKMDALIKEMFATPAHTPEGRRAKVTVLLVCILGNDWRGVDEETDYPELMARRLLIEFIGGEPGEQLRDQFCAEPGSLLS
jgi:hypothetical protein